MRKLKTMKIFLTEYQQYDKVYAGYNIFAESLEEAEELALMNGLIIVGEVTKIAFKPEFSENYLDTIKISEEVHTIH